MSDWILLLFVERIRIMSDGSLLLFVERNRIIGCSILEMCVSLARNHYLFGKCAFRVHETPTF